MHAVDFLISELLFRNEEATLNLISQSSSGLKESDGKIKQSHSPLPYFFCKTLQISHSFHSIYSLKTVIYDWIKFKPQLEAQDEVRR